MEGINEVFENLKLSEEVQAELKDKEVTPDLIKTALEDHNKNIRESFRDVLLNDPEFIKPIHAKAKGEVLGTMDTQLKSVFGDLEFEDSDGRKPYRAIFEEVKGRMEKAKGKGTEEIQQELVQTSKAFKALQEQIEKGEHPAIAKYRQELEELKEAQYYAASVDALKGLFPDAKTLGISPDDAALIVSSKLNSRSLTWGIGESGFEIKDKDGNWLRNSDNTELIKDPKRIVHAILEESGLIRKNNVDGNGTTTTTVTDDPKQKTVSGLGLEKARQNALRLQNRQP